MSNNYNSCPILINVDMASGWKSLQTLNTGNQPATIQSQQFNRTATSQPGIRPYRIQVLSQGTTAAGTVLIADPNDNTMLWQAAIGASAGASGTILIDETFDNTRPGWRDFKITGVTATVTQVQIWYRI